MPPDPDQDPVALLGRLYRRYKALALSVGASLALNRSPADAILAIDDLVADCRPPAATGRQLSEQFAACGVAAAVLADLARNAGRGDSTGLAGRLDATRASHRRLRKLVWEVASCEYVPCSGHADETDPGPKVLPAVGARGA